jgi:transposase
MLAPNVRKTWAPRGQTPLLKCPARRGKISAISALSLSPKRTRVTLYARFHQGKNIKAPEVICFLRHLLKHLRGHVFLVWDGGTCHRAMLTREYITKHPRLHVFRFPAYSPELNPDEFVWNNLKTATANCNPVDTGHLKRLLHPPLQRLRQSQKLLRSCLHASELPW